MGEGYLGQKALKATGILSHDAGGLPQPDRSKLQKTCGKQVYSDVCIQKLYYFTDLKMPQCVNRHNTLQSVFDGWGDFAKSYWREQQSRL